MINTTMTISFSFPTFTETYQALDELTETLSGYFEHSDITIDQVTLD